MSNINRVIKILKQIEVILRENHDTNWLPAIENFTSQLLRPVMAEDLAVILSKIIGMYGGMGSFSDLVLFEGGKVCYNENEQLDELRRELYEQCTDLLVVTRQKSSKK